MKLTHHIMTVVWERQVRRVVARHHPLVVAVVGSVGKTSTKRAIAGVLREHFRVLSGDGNYNSDLGMPLSVFGLTAPTRLGNPVSWIRRLLMSEWMIWRHFPYEALVLELGTDHPGEIPRFASYLHPDLVVVTAITPEHMANFADLDEVAGEELAIVKVANSVLFNADDIPLKYQTEYLLGRPHVYSYGETGAAHYTFTKAAPHQIIGNVVHYQEGPVQVLSKVPVTLFGDHILKATAAAFGAGRLLGQPASEIRSGLTKLKPTPGRMNLLRGHNGSTILDDSYNSSPDAAIAALTALMQTKAKRRIAVLGSMNELGDASPEYHAQVGRAAAEVDLLLTVGDLASYYLGPAAVAVGLVPSQFKAFRSPYAAGEYLKKLLKPGDVVLVKGSQNNVFTEEATRLLLADDADSVELVRKTRKWMMVKAGQFGS